MMSEKLTRKGQIAKDQEGSLLLVDEKNKAYKVDEVVAAVWSKFNDKTVDEVADDISNEIGADKEKVKEAVKTIATDLKHVNLL